MSGMGKTDCILWWVPQPSRRQCWKVVYQWHLHCVMSVSSIKTLSLIYGHCALTFWSTFIYITVDLPQVVSNSYIMPYNNSKYHVQRFSLQKILSILTVHFWLILIKWNGWNITIINSNIFNKHFCKKNTHSNHAVRSTVSSTSLCTSENKATIVTMAMSVWYTLYKHHNNVIWSTCLYKLLI